MVLTQPSAPTRPSLLPDELVRALVAAGPVELLVGIPTLDNAQTIGAVVRAAVEALSGPLSRRRSLILDADGGSQDGTPAIVEGAAAGPHPALVATLGLRTIHRISTPYHGLPGRESGLRLLFAAADLVGAKAVLILDPHARSTTPATVAAFAGSVLDDGYDFVNPVIARSPWEYPLVTQLVAPLMSAAYGRSLRDPTATQFACTGSLAAAWLRADPWEAAPQRNAVDVRLTAFAMLVGRRLAELREPGASEPVRSSAHTASPREAFQEVVGTLFETLSRDEWLRAASPASPDLLGAKLDHGRARPPFDVDAFRDAFVRAVRDLAPILELTLGESLLHQLASCAGGPTLDLPDALWAALVWASLSAIRRRVLPSAQVVGALFPLYLGRTATFLRTTRDATEDEALASTDRLSDAFVRARPAYARTIGVDEVTHG
ncbi:MAG: hypothetical protein HY791_38380 [Deltaproteobacteria bacterium]|nr:hypothetical protein [Deltaproteobacteria bacterium]